MWHSFGSVGLWLACLKRSLSGTSCPSLLKLKVSDHCRCCFKLSSIPLFVRAWSINQCFAYSNYALHISNDTAQPYRCEHIMWGDDFDWSTITPFLLLIQILSSCLTGSVLSSALALHVRTWSSSSFSHGMSINQVEKVPLQQFHDKSPAHTDILGYSYGI